MIRPLNDIERRRHKVRNRIQSALLLGGMALLLTVCGWAIAGIEGVLWTLFLGIASVVAGSPFSPEITLRLYGALPLKFQDSPELFHLLARISEDAGLARIPDLYYLPSGMLNAFALGARGQLAICLTDGLLRNLTVRELAGVIAHEVSHIRNNDLWVMSLADVISRLTGTMSVAGIFLLAVNLPLLLLEQTTAPWLLVAMLLFSPTLAALLQLGLSRTREYDADLDAAALTGDPRGLASALAKLERIQGGLLETLFLPGRRVPDPSLLRTHPPTQTRIERLLSLEQRAPDKMILGRIHPQAVHVPARLADHSRRPYWHPTGVWY